jgi:Icc-related predicted phosphoesterase
VPKNIILANNKIISLEGIYFYGLVSDYNLSKIPKLSTKPIDFLLSHVPPKSILDEDIGCAVLLEFVKLQKPKHHLFGHIHSFGLQMKTLHKTVFINCCTFPEI